MQINSKVQRGRVGCERTDPGDMDGSEHSPIRNVLSAQKKNPHLIFKGSVQIPSSACWDMHLFHFFFL